MNEAIGRERSGEDPDGRRPRGPDLLRELRERTDRRALGLPPRRRPPHPTQAEIARLLTARLGPGGHVGERRFRDLERLHVHPWPKPVGYAYARLLALRGRERLEFFAAIGCLPPVEVRSEVTKADRDHLDWSLRVPAYISDENWDVRFRNRLLAELVPDLLPGMNVIEYVLVGPRAREIFPDLRGWAIPMLGQLRRALLDAEDARSRAGLLGVINTLIRSPEVAELWESGDDVALSPNGDVRWLRPADPDAPDGLGPLVPVQLYVMTPLGRPPGWRIMSVTPLNDVEPHRSTDDDYGFWFPDTSSAAGP